MRVPRAVAMGAVALLAVLLIVGGPLAGAAQAEPAEQWAWPQTSGPCSVFNFYPWAMFGPCGIGSYQGASPFPGVLGLSIGSGPYSGFGPSAGFGLGSGFGPSGGCPVCPGSSPFGGMGFPGAEMPGAPGAGMPGAPAAAMAAAQGTPVAIGDNFFRPAEVTVPVGTRVTWLNGGTRQHTVTDPGVWDSGALNPGQRYSAVFAIAGTFDYVCTIHPDEMRGRVTVTAQ